MASSSSLQTINLTIFFLLIMSFVPRHGATTTTRYTRIGVIINNSSRMGKEAKVAMEIAAGNFNGRSKNHKVILHFISNTGGNENPLQAAYAAEELISKKDVQALVGMESWEETASVAEVGKKAKIPIISLASNAISQPLKPLQWPYLLEMSSNFTEQISFVVDMIRSFRWRKVIAIYELDRYGGDSGTCEALSEALQRTGIEIEYRLSFPAFVSLMTDNPQGFIREKLMELTRQSCRVFILLRSSVSLASFLFKEAGKIGLFGMDSAWIMTEDIASSLWSLNTSAISTMEGALGIEPYYPHKSRAFLDFKRKFKRIFQSEYPDETNLNLGIYALRAHDSIKAIARAAAKQSSTSSNTLLETILFQNIIGLSGKIYSSNGELWHSSSYRVLNVLPKGPTSLGFWSAELGFSERLRNEGSKLENGSSVHGFEVLGTLVKWPGNINRVPKGWLMPSLDRPMKIGVPRRATFQNFVEVEWDSSSSPGSYDVSGYCIDVFKDVVKILGKSYPLAYELEPYNGSYDSLVDHVANKTYDAAVGDITILATRWRKVEFTQPFAESGLSMIVPKEPDHSLIFFKPFTKATWAITCAILMYTVLIVWLLERSQLNPEFHGPWHVQLSIAVWFTFSSVFFAQREQVRSNYTRVVVIVWFFVVLALTISYSASLSSLLTVNQLRPKVTDIDWLKAHNSTIACSANSFIPNYLQDVLGFHAGNIKKVGNELNFIEEFESGNIAAAFLELPYEKAFLNQYCQKYTVPQYTKQEGDRFGGLGFVFEKGSPIATDVSEAILILSENGVLKQLYQKWFTPSPSCATSQSNVDYNGNSLNWRSFWGLYLFTASISTMSFLISTIHRYYERRCRADNCCGALFVWLSVRCCGFPVTA